MERERRVPVALAAAQLRVRPREVLRYIEQGRLRGERVRRGARAPWVVIGSSLDALVRTCAAT